MSRHHLFDPDGMAPAKGFTYGAIAAPGHLLHLAGITGHREDDSIAGDLVGQFSDACRSLVSVIEAAGGSGEDLVHLTIYTTDVADYREQSGPIGVAYRQVFGRHFPPMALIGVSELFDPRAVVELVGVAVVPEPA